MRVNVFFRKIILVTPAALVADNPESHRIGGSNAGFEKGPESVGFALQLERI